MDIQEITNLFMNSGAAIGILVYAIWKDYKFTAKITETLTKLDNAIDDIKQIVMMNKDNKED